MTMTASPAVDPQVAEAIVATVRDYYEGWFDGDAERMRRALHPDLIKRGIADPAGTIDTDTATTMIDATEQGIGTRHPVERRGINISINHVHVDIADVHVSGAVYVDYLQLVHVGGRWQILNALWAPAETARLT